MEIPFIFPEIVSHVTISNQFEMIAEENGWVFEEVVSAGSVTLGLSITCYSDSYSIGVRSRPDRDSHIIATADYGGIFA